jgi:hypothetical protein
VASSTPFQYDPPVATAALVLLGPAALLISNVLAVWPGGPAADRTGAAHRVEA